MTASEPDLTTTVFGFPAKVVEEEAVARRRPRKKPKFKDTWWRHAAGIVGLLISLFPVVFIVSSAFNRDQSIGGAQIVPTHVTLHNFGNLLHNNVATSGGGKADAPYVSWYVNSLIVAAATALFTVMLSALAAYAFSRFRFKGRRLGMMTLLLIQMFPQFLAIVAIYLIVLNVGDIFHVIGINTLLGVIVVYLGGALGVQAWLLKGFFDTIPSELDESARVDGATAGQIFWGVVLPLAAPVLVVVALISFVGTLNEYVIASALLQTTDHFTLPVGMRGFIDQQYGQRWGPFAAGALLAAVPVAALFLFLQKYIVSGLTAGSVKG
jgi:arabinogalactan oligomer / maltooligosaccharide transport system permease protein